MLAPSTADCPLVDRAVAYKTVATFSGITGKKIFLKEGESCKTDGHVITISFSDPNYYQKLEHALAHILFGSDPIAKADFVSEYVGAVARHAEGLGVEIRRDRLSFLLSSIVGLLEDHRVNSLWGRLYPGSYEAILDLAHQRAETLVPKAHTSMLYSMVCVYAGSEVPLGAMTPFLPIFLAAFEKIEGRDFSAALVVAKWVVIRAVDLIVEASRSIRLDALQKLSGELMSDADNLEELGQLFEDIDDLALPKFVEVNRPSGSVVNKVIRFDANSDTELSKFLDNSKQEMDQLITMTHQQLRGPLQREDWIQQDARVKVMFQDIAKSDITEPAPPLSSQELATIRRLRSVFHRVMGRRALELRDTGIRIDVPAYIERSLTGEPIPCFQEETSGRGFRCLVLLDRSTSMGHDRGQKTTQSELACRLLSKALRYPFVEFEIWGFQAREGEVTISRFEKGLESFTSDKSLVMGHTPLHIAIQLAARHLEAPGAIRQLVVITDGAPTFGAGKSYIVIDDKLIDATRAEVQEARKRGVRVTGLVIDRTTSPSQLFRMFGPHRNWNYLDKNAIGEGIVKTVTGSFLQYLRDA